MQEIDVASVHDKETMFNNDPINVFTHKVKKNKIGQKIKELKASRRQGRKHVASTDTTTDRPCCCGPRHSGSTITIQSISTYDDTNLSSEIDQLFLQKGNFFSIVKVFLVFNCKLMHYLICKNFFS